MAIDDRLAVGSVLFEFVTATIPPKNKYYIVVGISENEVALGTVYINSEINPNIFNTPQLRGYHIPISAEEYPFLKYDSFIDCSHIEERSVSDVLQCLNNDNKRYGYYASISAIELDTVLQTLDNAHTIAPVVKKKFGIRK